MWRKVLTMEEAAEICAVHRTTMTRVALAGDLMTSMIGERRLVDEHQLALFLEKSFGGRVPFVAPAGASGYSNAVGLPDNRVCAKKEDPEIYICPKALTVKEAALAVRIHWTNLAKFVSSGELKSVKIGSARRVFAFDLWVFFENRIDGKDVSLRKEAC